MPAWCAAGVGEPPGLNHLGLFVVHRSVQLEGALCTGRFPGYSDKLDLVPLLEKINWLTLSGSFARSCHNFAARGGG